MFSLFVSRCFRVTASRLWRPSLALSNSNRVSSQAVSQVKKSGTSASYCGNRGAGIAAVNSFISACRHEASHERVGGLNCK